MLLWLVAAGVWQEPREFGIGPVDESVSMDRRLKQLMASVQWNPAGPRERQEHLAILTRWFHSSWRDGEWVAFESFDRVSYRKLVNAISRTSRATV